MTGFPLANSHWVVVEIGPGALRVLDGGAGLELPLDRQENGRLTAACQDQLVLRLREFLRTRSWRRRRAFCAIGARGVSLRRLKVPAAAKDELHRVLLLQIEREFPLPPQELAWGACPVGSANGAANGGVATQEALVVAVRREPLAEYAQLLAKCGLDVVFTVGALARGAACPSAPAAYSVLEVGRSHSELVCFAAGAPVGLRILPWGADDLARALEQRLGLSREEAERLLAGGTPGRGGEDEARTRLLGALGPELDAWAAALGRDGLGARLYVCSPGPLGPGSTACLAAALGSLLPTQPLELEAGPGRSAATVGLRTACARDGEKLPLVLELPGAGTAPSQARALPAKWLRLAAVLVLSALALRYAEGLVRAPGLSRRLAEAKAFREKLPAIDRELNFLQYLKTNQPPYLDMLATVSGAAAPGARLESFALNRRGELSLRVTMQNPQQAVEFRSNLVASGAFSSAMVEEQSPSPDRQKLTVRLSAQCQAFVARDAAAAPRLRPEPEKPKSAAGEARGGPATNTAGAPLPALPRGPGQGAAPSPATNAPGPAAAPPGPPAPR